MASAANPYILGAQVGMSALSSYMNYQADLADAQKSLMAIDLQREAATIRHRQSVRTIRRRAKAFQAKQKGAYISSGVKLEGSAITALGDALANELEATLAQEQQFEETERTLMLNEADVRERMSNAGTAAFLGFLGSAAGSYAQFERNR
jgi:hypothetical protein